MCRIPLLTIAILGIASGTATSQIGRPLQRPISVPQSRVTTQGGGSSHHWHTGNAHDRFRPGGADMRMVAEWYRQFLDRQMTPGESVRWQRHLRDGGPLEGVAAMLLGGDEYFARSGRRFDRWMDAVETSTGRRIPRDLRRQWTEDHRRARSRDQTNLRVDMALQLLQGQSQRPPLIHPPRPGHPGRPWEISRPRTDVPWYVQDVQPRRRR